VLDDSGIPYFNDPLDLTSDGIFVPVENPGRHILPNKSDFEREFPDGKKYFQDLGVFSPLPEPFGSLTIIPGHFSKRVANIRYKLFSWD